MPIHRCRSRLAHILIVAAPEALITDIYIPVA